MTGSGRNRDVPAVRLNVRFWSTVRSPERLLWGEAAIHMPRDEVSVGPRAVFHTEILCESTDDRFAPEGFIPPGNQ
jgi:hypothetical protein